eukprot:CAMPEP_0198220052 /NCGR_PEP_ID=MMETSP1445-20131203/77324_1 /TAXON_ID=36898 /ORGANISM="Pyramimonas sp., Strain CCMP2087" /LENGTH=79 /DNA_ID=CAMNT_0043897681 /DNA_START=56 /DNA_END=291 /DNA_ORIENTATION=-
MASYYKPVLRGVTSLRDVPCWADLPQAESSTSTTSSGVNGVKFEGDGAKQESRFPVNEEANSKVFLWRGDPWLLEVDAV